MGLTVKESDGALKVTGIVYDFPAYRYYGLSCGDIILALQETPVNRKNWADVLKTNKPGNILKLQFRRRDKKLEIDIPMEENKVRSFAINSLAKPNDLQQLIFANWLKD